MPAPNQPPFIVEYLFEKYIENLQQAFRKTREHDMPAQLLADLRKSAPVSKFLEFAHAFFDKVHETGSSTGPHGTVVQLSNLDSVLITPQRTDYVEGAINVDGFVPITGN